MNLFNTSQQINSQIYMKNKSHQNKSTTLIRFYKDPHNQFSKAKYNKYKIISSNNRNLTIIIYRLQDH